MPLNPGGGEGPAKAGCPTWLPGGKQQDAAHALSRCGEVVVSCEEAAAEILDKRRAQLNLTIEQEDAGMIPSGPSRAELEAAIAALEAREGPASAQEQSQERQQHKLQSFEYRGDSGYTTEELDAMSSQELENAYYATLLRNRYREGYDDEEESTPARRFG